MFLINRFNLVKSEEWFEFEYATIAMVFVKTLRTKIISSQRRY